jgi:hypothetical protein
MSNQSEPRRKSKRLAGMYIQLRRTSIQISDGWELTFAFGVCSGRSL